MEVGNRLGALPGGGEGLSGCGVIARCRQRLRQGAQGPGALVRVGNRLGALPGGGEGLSGCYVIARCRQRLRQLT